MFSPIPIGQMEQKAIRIILGLKGEQPKNLKQLVMQLWPDLENCPSSSTDKRVQSLKRTLRQRSGSTKSLYQVFYFRKRRNEKLGPKEECSLEDLAFLEEMYQCCPSWLTLQDKIRNVLEGSSFRKMMIGEKEALPPNTNL